MLGQVIEHQGTIVVVSQEAARSMRHNRDSADTLAAADAMYPATAATSCLLLGHRARSFWTVVPVVIDTQLEVRLYAVYDIAQLSRSSATVIEDHCFCAFSDFDAI